MAGHHKSKRVKETNETHYAVYFHNEQMINIARITINTNEDNLFTALSIILILETTAIILLYNQGKNAGNG